MGKIHIKEIDQYTDDDIFGDECAICGKPKHEWSVVKHENYCPDCYYAVVHGLRDLKKTINFGCVEVMEFKEAIEDLFGYAFPRGGYKDD